METKVGSFAVKKGLAQMLKGGVIMDVVTPEHAKIAEEAGACAVMALERVPADIRADGGVARMSDPGLIIEIMETVSIPVMAKARIGHFVEAQILEAIGVDYVDESEVLTPADEAHHINKHDFKIPFVCGCRNLGEALRRIGEGAAMIRTKGEAGTGDIFFSALFEQLGSEILARVMGVLLTAIILVAVWSIERLSHPLFSRVGITVLLLTIVAAEYIFEHYSMALLQLITILGFTVATIVIASRQVLLSGSASI